MYFFRSHNFNPLRYNYKNNLPSSSPVVKVIVIVTVFFAAFHVVYMRPNIYLHLYTTKYISAFFSQQVLHTHKNNVEMATSPGRAGGQFRDYMNSKGPDSD